MVRSLVVAVTAVVLAAPASARVAYEGAAFPRGAILVVSTRPAAVDAGSGVYAVDAASLSPKELAVDIGPSARWSPDGRWIAFGQRRGGTYDLVVMRVAGGRQTSRRIFRGDDPSPSSYFRAFSWSPDGRRLVFTRGRVGIYGQGLTIATVDGRRSRRLTAPVPRRADSAPAWSPDGRRIAFVRDDRCNTGGICGGLYVIGSDGTGLRRVFVGSSPVNSRPSWSPDGRRIVFGLSAGGARVVDVDRKRTRVIASGGSLAAAWSPDGRWIALVGSGTAIVRPDGTGYRRISTSGGRTPSWSPDSRAVAVTESSAGADVIVVAVDGSGERRITEGGRYEYENSAPEWNPRGLSTGQLRGARVSPANPTDSVIESGVLRTARPVIRLSADGARLAAVTAQGGDDSVGKIDVWDVEREQVTRFRMSYFARNNTSFRSHAFAFAGERVATTWINSGGGIDTWNLETATLTTPSRTRFQTTSSTWPGLCCSTPLEHLAGDGALLVADAWGQCRISQSQPCASGPKFGGRLLRVGEADVVELASDRGGLTLLSVDRDRILVDRENGALQLFAADGSPRYAIAYGPAKLLGAAIEGDDVVALTSFGLADYDAATGDLRRQRPLPGADARLNDLAGGVAVYSVGRDIHLMRLRDDRDAVIRPPGTGPTLAQLERAGLFYSYTTDDAKSPGRVAFVPFDRLP